MPADASRKLSGPPTLPKPWIVTRDPAKGRPRRSNAARTTTTRPLEVAPAWARVPPIDIGLPVTEPGRCPPLAMVSVSISQAITRPSVFTSGAGMSRLGPSSGEISKV